MIIGKAGSYGSNYNYYQNINQMRLERALEKNPRYQLSVQAVKPAPRVSSYYNDNRLDFMKSYSAEMADMMGSANSLRSENSGSAVNELSVASSDTAVADVSLRYSSKNPKAMALDVQSVAKGQTNVSAGEKSTDQAGSDMDFVITQKENSVSVYISALKDNGTARTNKEMLKEAARQINAGYVGVTAVVTDKKGVASLKLQSKSTGEDSAFTVSGEMGAAEGAQNVDTAAQNARYTIKEQNVTRAYTSQTNEVYLDAPHITAKLKDTGKTNISIQSDPGKIIKGMSDLIDSYNRAVKFLSKNINRGDGVMVQRKRLETNLGSEVALKQLGISKQEDGTLALDKSELTKQLKEEPKLTKDLISGSGGIAQNLFHKAANAMQTSPEQLMNFEEQENNLYSVYNSNQLMGRYGTMQMNYAMAGMLINYLV
ncbi:flagellar filament capping protein FliD [Lacrimispora sp.]|uniref:flagellar filament capping protein FliD n=1 Tax=Lacrimispora sp. TaxID=2719234 RepID=UPI00289A28D5|nr:flagellar filament capping protein FliD [Lacrimispora sp.]